MRYKPVNWDDWTNGRIYIRKSMGRPLFKPATPEQVRNRQDPEARQLYAHAEKVIPGSVEKLKRTYGKDVLVLTAIAYGDSGHVGELLGRTSDSIRCLKWVGVWTDAKTFIKQCEIVVKYNNFDVDVAKRIMKYFPGKEFRLGRENSVVIEIRPVDEKEYKAIGEDQDGYFQHGRTSFNANILMVWWD